MMASDLDRVKGGLAAFVRSLFPRVDYYALYPSTVVKQNADGTLELTPDDQRFAGMSGVPIRYGLPDVSATMTNGARVLLGFAGGDPAKPIAVLWESASISGLTLGASGTTQPAALATALRTELDAIWAAIYSGHVHGGVVAGGATSGTAPGSASRQTIASATVKVKT